MSKVDERAQRAVKVFRSMQPGLTGYARAITGRSNVKVQIDDGTPRTDGTTIFYKPPIALGDTLVHARQDCDRREAGTNKQLCRACRVREEVLSSIYHEIAHITFGTFQEVTPEARNAALERAVEEAPGKYADGIRDKWEKIPDYKKKDYMNLASLISPYLPVLINALEDARVDEAMFQARKGTRVMLDVLMRTLLAEGSVQDDGTVMTWLDKPLNSQVLIGIFTLAVGYEYSEWFAPEVVEALNDKRIVELTSRVSTIRSAEGTYDLAFPILARLRELGFCKAPEDPEVEPDPEPQPQENSDDETDKDESDDDQEPSEAGGDESSSESGSEDSDDSSDASDGDGSQDDREPAEKSSSDSDSSGEPSEGEEGEPVDDESNSSGGGSPESASGDEGERDGSDEADWFDSESDSEGEAGDESDDGESGDRSGSSDEDQSGKSSEELLESLEQSSEDEDELPEPLDGGAHDDDGVKAEEPYYGTPEDAKEDLKVFTHHEDTEYNETQNEGDAVKRAVIQGAYFEKPSANVYGVREHKFDNVTKAAAAWDEDSYSSYYNRLTGKDTDLNIPEQVLGPALLEMRRTFEDNARATHERNKKAGKVNARVLGKRAPFDDGRLFQKKRLPGKKSYAVLLGIDISGSTIGLNLALAKRAAKAQAELCNRVGVDFAIYAHTANTDPTNYTNKDLFLDIYEIKSFDAPWNAQANEALEKIGSDAQNLDGHTIEYYRKMIERHPATDKIIMYYTDGAMPAENYHEELEILQREIEYCKRRSITLMGVGIRTDSPTRHGLDTVQVDDDSDVSKVVRHLQSGLVKSR